MRTAKQEDVDGPQLGSGEWKRAGHSRKWPQVRRDTLTNATFVLTAKPPFRLDLTAWAIHRRGKNHIDEWNDEAYRRLLVVGGKGVLVTVRQAGGIDAPRLHVLQSSYGLEFGAAYVANQARLRARE